MTIARLIGIASLLAIAVAVYSGIYQPDRKSDFALTYLAEAAALTCGIVAIIQSRDDDGRRDVPALALGIVGISLAALLAALTFLVHALGSLAYA